MYVECILLSLHLKCAIKSWFLKRQTKVEGLEQIRAEIELFSIVNSKTIVFKYTLVENRRQNDKVIPPLPLEINGLKCMFCRS